MKAPVQHCLTRNTGKGWNTTASYTRTYPNRSGTNNTCKINVKWRRISRDLSNQVIPRHLAIIMDGNGRWAQQRGLPRMSGHQEGVQTVKRTVEDCTEIVGKTLTLHSFSTENWRRQKMEVDHLHLFGGRVHKMGIARLTAQWCLSATHGEPGRAPHLAFGHFG